MKGKIRVLLERDFTLIFLAQLVNVKYLIEHHPLGRIVSVHDVSKSLDRMRDILQRALEEDDECQTDWEDGNINGPDRASDSLRKSVVPVSKRFTSGPLQDVKRTS